ncbi:four helix bundle protein [Mucilaginibacter gilvus]|uniref:four helix bundle protein n=1 Tax=Mucilaginibacter gilvus TaxID=2305909 RepID=UPI001ABAAAE2|nr:four helix bundle protein [Mucilaginibacter gilvus]
MQVLLGRITGPLVALNLKRTLINKLKIVEEELDETMFFLELLVELNPELKEKITPIYKEGNELLSIIVAAINTLRAK